MIQALRLGFHNCSNLASSAVIHKPPKVEPLQFVKLRAMSNQSSSTPHHAPKKGGHDGNEILEDDGSTIEKMTIQQLRSKLRSVGIPGKGSKHELVSVLRSFLNREINGDGCTTLEEDEVSSEEKANAYRGSSKRISKKLSRKDHFPSENNVPEASGPKGTKRRVEEAPDEDNTLKVQTTKSRKKEEQSVESLEMKGKMSVRAKTKVSLETASMDVGIIDRGVLSVNQSEPWTIFAHKKPQKGWIAYNPKTMRPTPPGAGTEYVKLMSWNVNGLRALLKLGSFPSLAQREKFDVLCLQETKLQERDVEMIKQSLLDGYQYSYWTCSISKLGYSGTAVISRIKPVSVRYGLGISDHDTEGRLITVEFDNFFLLSGYVPNSGDGLRRLSYRITEWDPSLSNYVKELEKSKPVILTGDLNCAHEEIDIYNPAGNKRSAGFTIEERESFETNFLHRGFVDTFRRQHPGVVGYTYWGYRHGGRKTNKGWRLDYFLVSESIADKVHDSYILPDVTGSDHCPIGLIVKV